MTEEDEDFAMEEEKDEEYWKNRVDTRVRKDQFKNPIDTSDIELFFDKRTAD